MSEIQVIVHKSERIPKSLPSAKQHECPICFSSIIEEEKLSLKDCQHTFCKDCLQEYLRTEINSMNLLKIKCPEQTCSCILNSQILQGLLESSDFERYQKLLLKKIAKRTQNIICPKPGCSKIILPMKNTPSTKCNCGAVVCNLCGSLDHPNKTCIAALDPEFEAYSRENNLKMCLMCKTMISRVKGCLHITCSVCDYDWCWICGREYTELHERKCPRTWSPLPPKSIARESLEMSTCERITTSFSNILKLLSYAFMLQVFFPFVLLNVLVELRMPARTREYKINLLCSTIFVEVLYIFFVGLIIFLMIAYPSNVNTLIGCLILTLFVPWGAKLMQLYLTRNENKKRWRSRNSQAFHYTPTHKPAADLEGRQQPVQAQPQVEVKAEPELKDENRIETQEIRIYSQETNAPLETESSPLTSTHFVPVTN